MSEQQAVNKRPVITPEQQKIIICNKGQDKKLKWKKMACSTPNNNS